MNVLPQPELESREANGIRWWTDPRLLSLGTLVAFTERGGGVSPAPYASLNLASHVGDEPANVDENRTRLLEALGLAEKRSALVMAEQVHSTSVRCVTGKDAGRGAYASSGRPPFSATDGLVTTERGLPLMLCFADCVPVVLVSPRGVGVVHAGWRGALGGIPAEGARLLAKESGCSAAELTAYIGPHIGSCHYDVDPALLSQFTSAFGTLARADSGGLDLSAVVSASLEQVGVISCNIARLGVCTAENTGLFFSYRAEGNLTGRHGALVCAL
ncbi:MAG: polyphenol oxidase family protein [Coriobacteriia bacterium]